jgi:hypothetical protein
MSLGEKFFAVLAWRGCLIPTVLVVVASVAALWLAWRFAL